MFLHDMETLSEPYDDADSESEVRMEIRYVLTELQCGIRRVTNIDSGVLLR
jgi:hypothetical protein